MPISIKCSICGARSPRLGFAKRMAWLRKHKKRKHYSAFRASIRKGVLTRKRRKGTKHE